MRDLLRLENVTKQYGDQKAVNDLSFCMKEGEIMGLIGPNGAGKTTLMRMIVGLIKKYEGNIFVDGSDIRKKPYFNKKIIGSVIETPSFYPYMTGYENLKYFSELHGGYDPKDIEEIGKLLGMTEALSKKVKQYSLGMRQRLGIAQALLHDPKILVLDEPTNGLDPMGIHEIRNYLKKIAVNKGISILISSHILSEIEKVCDKVLIIQKGTEVKTYDLSKGGVGQAEISYVFESDEPKRLIACMKKMGKKIMKNHENKVIVACDKSQIPEIIKVLSKEGILLTSVYENQETLEDNFLELIGVNKIE
jgi:ABC-2 type transport system ATP-binding protein